MAGPKHGRGKGNDSHLKQPITQVTEENRLLNTGDCFPWAAREVLDLSSESDSEEVAKALHRMLHHWERCKPELGSSTKLLLYIAAARVCLLNEKVL